MSNSICKRCTGCGCALSNGANEPGSFPLRCQWARPSAVTTGILQRTGLGRSHDRRCLHSLRSYYLDPIGPHCGVEREFAELGWAYLSRDSLIRARKS
jgi:hypothetical protein